MGSGRKRPSTRSKKALERFSASVRAEQNRHRVLLPGGAKRSNKDLDIPTEGLIQKQASGPTEDMQYSDLYTSMVVVRITNRGEKDAVEALDTLQQSILCWEREWTNYTTGEDPSQSRDPETEDQDNSTASEYDQLELPFPESAGEEGGDSGSSERSPGSGSGTASP